MYHENTKANTCQFIQVEYTLLGNKTLNHSQKSFIGYLLGWQANGKICFESNTQLANRFGLKYSGIRTIINSLNKYDFFHVVQLTETVDGKTFVSGHQLKIDEPKLAAFLALEQPLKSDVPMEQTTIPTPKTVEPVQTPITEPEQTKSFLDELAEMEDENQSFEDFEAAMGEPIKRETDNLDMDEPYEPTESFDVLKFIQQKKIRPTTKIESFENLDVLNEVVDGNFGVLNMIILDLKESKQLPTTFEKSAEFINQSINEYLQHKKQSNNGNQNT